MGHIDPRVDAYIVKSAAFAIPILEHLRALVHHHCPDVKETMKWSFPNFEYKGNILCSMASFKQHCSFGFWQGAKLTDPHGLLKTGQEKTAMGNLGRITSIDSLPEDRFLEGFIREAMELIDKGVKSKPGTTKPPKPLVVPDDLTEALEENSAALSFFMRSTPSFKKAYVEWLDEAKTEGTRQKRIATAVEWIAEGKSRHWKYER